MDLWTLFENFCRAGVDVHAAFPEVGDGSCAEAAPVVFVLPHFRDLSFYKIILLGTDFPDIVFSVY